MDILENLFNLFWWLFSMFPHNCMLCIDPPRVTVIALKMWLRAPFWNWMTFFNFWRTLVLYVGPLLPLFLTSGEFCPAFQSKDESLCFHALSPAYIVFLRFTSGSQHSNHALFAHLLLQALIWVKLLSLCVADIPCNQLSHWLKSEWFF